MKNAYSGLKFQVPENQTCITIYMQEHCIKYNDCATKNILFHKLVMIL